MFASAFAIYFAFQKIGNSVSASYEVSMELFSAEYISKVILSNKKDKTISVWSMHAVVNKDMQLELNKFDPPLILKAYETIAISLPKYSELYLGNDKFLPEFMTNDIRLHIDIGDKLLACKDEKKKPDTLKYFSQIGKRGVYFNGHIYNDHVIHILCYYYDEKPHTAFIDKSGIIGNEWGFSYNNIGKADASSDDVREFLENSGLSDIFTNYLCYKVTYPEINIAFRKAASDTET